VLADNAGEQPVASIIAQKISGYGKPRTLYAGYNHGHVASNTSIENGTLCASMSKGGRRHHMQNASRIPSQQVLKGGSRQPREENRAAVR